MSVTNSIGWRQIFLRISATLLCAVSTSLEAAPASKTPKPQLSFGATRNKLSSKAPSARAKKSATTETVTGQPAYPSNTTDKKSGEQAPAAKDIWPTPPAPRQFTSETPIDTSIPPPLLPRASRMRMRACAEEWTRKKLVARNDLPRWRDFAADCLSQKEKH